MSYYMQKAIQLAQEGRYLASPNPMVGCVIEQDGKIVGSGWHKGPGTPHAEIEALKEAGELAKGANLYVNLEPCSHYGRTPPCADALIKAQVKCVYAAMTDPNPLVNGEGIRRLREAGITVYVGDDEKSARYLNENFIHYIATKRPFVIAKWAMTLDGKITTETGDSKWITDVPARTHVHQLRKSVDAILVGSNTVLRDDPQLTARGEISTMNTRQPVRIILDSSGRTSLDSEVYQTNTVLKTLVATTEKSPMKWRDELQAIGVSVQIFDLDAEGHICIEHLLDVLGKQGISSLLIEGGAKVLTSFFKNKLINKVYTYIAPKVIGGVSNLSPLLDMNIFEMSKALDLTFHEYQTLESDQLLISYPNWGGGCLPVL